MTTSELIPGPLTTSTWGDGVFPLDEETTLTAGPETDGTARWLRAVLVAATGLPLREGEPGPPGHAAENSVELRLDPQLPPEGYRITVRDRRALVTGGGPAGVFWGAQTLRQLLGPDAFRRAPLRRTGWQLPETEIQDAPRFAWRGLMLDVSRHFMPKDGVLRYLDLMAAHKLNVFHFHLTDDQGWRIEIKRYPKLTETGSWRARTKFGHRASPLWEDKPHGGFYTQDDIREIVAYATERHIAVVPEIDIPGHSQAAIAAYPELGNTDVIDTTSSPSGTPGASPKTYSPPLTTSFASTRASSRKSSTCSPRTRSASRSSSTSAATSAPRTSGRRHRPRRRGSWTSGSRTWTNSSRGSSATSTTGWPRTGVG